MAGKAKTWIWVVVAVLVVIVLGLIAAAGVGFYFVSQHLDTSAAAPIEAAPEFEAVRARFGGEPPLLELDERGRIVRRPTTREPPADSTKPTELRLLAYDASGGRLVRFRVPFWLLRMKMASGALEVDGTRVDLRDLQLTVEDLERYGPVLLIDHQAPEGERVVVWTE